MDFADKSGKGVLLTANGDAKISSGDSKFDGASLFLDGAGDYVTIQNSNPSINPEDKDFTIDFWFKRTDSDTVTRPLVSRWESTAGDYRCWEVVILGGTSHKIQASVTPDGGSSNQTDLLSTTTYNDSAWHHVAFVRTGDTLLLFVDGILEASDTFVGSVYNSSRDAAIGGDDAGNSVFQGYIDEVRIVKGRAIWTTNFLVPDASQPALLDNDVLLMSADGDDDSTAFKDTSPSVHTLTANGSAKISTDQSKFGGSSAYFNGSDAYISAPDSNDWHLGLEDFTIDCWVYRTSSGEETILSQSSDDGNQSFLLHMTALDMLEFIGYSASDGTVGVTVTSTGTIGTSAWHHVAVVRQGSSWKLYIDGEEDGSASASVELPNVSTDLRIGCKFASSSATSLFTGYIDELRITKDEVRFTERFIPPIRAYPRTTDSWDFPQDTDDYTVLLLHFNGSNGSTSDHDYSQSRHTVAFLTNAEISTAASKFGGSSLYVDDTTGSRVSMGDSDDWDFGSEPWTLECWFNLSQIGNNNMVIAQKKSTADADNWWSILKNSSDLIEFRAHRAGSDVARYSCSPTLAAATWYHLVYEYDGSDIRCFLDGIEQTLTETTAYGGTMPTPNAPLTVGSDGDSNSPFHGYIDEVRVSKGVARYTENFQPQTRQFPDAQDESIKLLLHMESVDGVYYIKDSSYRGHSVYPENGTTLSKVEKKFGQRSCYFDHSDDYLMVPDSDDWHFSDGDFTIDFWWYPEDLTAAEVPMSHWEDQENFWAFQWASAPTEIRFHLYENNSKVLELAAAPSSFATDTWHHIAVARDGDTWRIFVDGDLEDSATDSRTMQNYAGGLYIGCRGASPSPYYVSGYLDEVRITKGVARWTATFTPSTRAQPDHM